MNYDDINNLLEKKPWIAVTTASLVIFTCVIILFINYSNKPHLDMSFTAVGQLVKKSWKQNQTLKWHQKTATAQQQQVALTQQEPAPLFTTVYCAKSQQNVVPLCARCNVPMIAVGDHHECPICKQKAHAVLCPNGDVASSTLPTEGQNQVGSQFLDDQLQTHNHVHVQNQTPNDGAKGFLCPHCGQRVQPIWDIQGRPHCPSCNGILNNYGQRAVGGI